MTNHWRDIRHADVIIINGANPAEAHPVGFQWFMRAKLDPKRGIGAGGGAKMIHIDPRFTRTSAVCDIHARLRTGTDAAFFGGLINYVLEKNLIHHEYVRHYTNASFLVKEGLRLQRGALQRLRPGQAHVRHLDVGLRGRRRGPGRLRPDPEGDPRPRAGTEDRRRDGGTVIAKRDMQLEHPRSVFQLMRKHYCALHPRDGGVDHRHPGRPVPGDRQDRRRDRAPRQGHDRRVRGRPHPPHHRRADDPQRGPAPAPAGQHGPARRRHERRARPRQHPGQHRQRDLLGDPARLPAHPGARPEEPGRLRRAERPQDVRHQFLELLRHQLPQVHGEPAQGLVRRRRQAGERVRLRLTSPSRSPTPRGSRSTTRRSRARCRG